MKSYIDRNKEIAKKIISKLNYEFGGSELDLINDTIINVLNNEDKIKTDELSTTLANVITDMLVKGSDKITFDYVYCKVYDLFVDSIFAEQVFDKVQIKLQQEHDIVLDKMSI